MLSLLDPVELEDIVIFRDDVEPQKFYPLPDQPIIPIDDQGNPEFLFIKYVKDVDTLPEGDRNVGGGLLQFRSVLTMKADRRVKIVDALRRRLKQEKAAGRKPFGHAIDSTEPLLAAPLWTSGKINLSTFKVSDTGLVRFATDNAPVDLAGDLGGSLSLELDETGAEIFWSAFQNRTEKQIPIMVTYQLTYKARVSATMTIHAERKVIHQKLIALARPYELMVKPFLRYVPLQVQEPFALAKLPALRAFRRAPVAAMIRRPQIRDAIRQTIVDNDIKVTITTGEDSGEQGAAAVRDALFKLATEVLAERVVPALFGDDSTRPGASTAAQDHANIDLVEVREGSSAQGDLTFDLTFDHQSTIDRQVNPNGPIELLIDNAETLGNSFKQLRLTDGFFRLMNVSATTTGVNFKEDGIETVHVFFEYKQIDDADPRKPNVARSKDDVLKSEQEAIHWRFDTARNADGSHKQAYRYMTEVFYREGPSSKSDWITSTTQKLVITPHAMGALRVELVLTAPEAQVASARVLLQHQTPSRRVFKAALELSQKEPKRTWFQYTGELAPDGDLSAPEYTYQVTYRAGGGEITMPVARTNSKTLEIPSPFKKTLSFTLRPQGSFENVRDISGDIVYEDSQHEYRFAQPFQIASLTASTVVNVPILEGGPETIRWKARINRNDGSVVDLGSGEAGAGTVFVGRQTLKVDILTDLVDFDTAVQLAVVQMSYHDVGNSISERKTFTFSKTAKGTQSWIVNRAPGGSAKYDAFVRFIAYDRSKSTEMQFLQIDQDVFLLDPAARV